MQKVLILTGACGVGKSTIATAWAKHHQGAKIDCDFFTEWIYKEDFPRWTSKEEAMTAEISIMVAKTYLQNGMDVAIENVWTPLGFTMIKDGLSKYPLKFVHLQCHLAENQHRDQLRIKENQMGARVEIVKNELLSYDWPAFVLSLDSTNLSIEETIKSIEKLDFI